MYRENKYEVNLQIHTRVIERIVTRIQIAVRENQIGNGQIGMQRYRGYSCKINHNCVDVSSRVASRAYSNDSDAAPVICII